MASLRDFPMETKRIIASSGEPGRPLGLTRAEQLTAREVAELLDVPVSPVHEWGGKGTLPRVKLGRHVRFIRAHVEAAILDAEMRPRVDRNLA